MKFSIRWLNELVSLDENLQLEDLANHLNLKGLEVEDIHTEKWDHIYIGQIIKQKNHPNASKLKLCEVSLGKSQQNLSIVCGAKNQTEGSKVAVCVEGAVLPNGLEIKNRPIRGEVSQGMLASESELGLSEESEGILLLPEEAPVGQRLDEYLKINDSYLDIAVAPNRSDLLSHIGLARELAGLLEKPMKVDHLFWAKSYKSKGFLLGFPIKSKPPQTQPLQFIAPSEPKTVTIHDSTSCPLYTYKIMRNVKVKESPLWLKKRLEFLGLKSINNIVDVTNWILQEWGQPLHAFDCDFLKGNIHVKKAPAKTRFTTLDQNKVIEFYGDELVISDDEKPVALAGIIGGQDSSIHASTQSILIEAAVFAPYAVRRIARRFGIDTLSAFHFSRGVFPQTTELALERACQMIQEVAGGQIEQHVVKAPSFSTHLSEIEISEDDLSERLGYEVSLSEFKTWMKRMNLSVSKVKSHKVWIQPPYYRKDLTIKEDLIEEWARLKGYDFVPEELPHVNFSNLKENSWLQFLDQATAIIKEQGYYQAINYNFIDHDFQEQFLGTKGSLGLKEAIMIQNPISQDFNSLRQSILPGLFKNFLTNIRHGQTWGRLFEQGVNFFKEDSQFVEKTYAAFLLWGYPKNIWSSTDDRSLFLDLKTNIENILSRLGYKEGWEWKPLNEDYPFLHPQHKQYLHLNNKIIGTIGMLNPILQEKYKVSEKVALGELNLSLLFDLDQNTFDFKVPSNLPIVRRDMSLVIPQNQPVGRVLQLMKENKPPECKDISIIDYFEGDSLKKGQRSVTFRLSFQGQVNNLSEKQISKYIEKQGQMLLKKLSIKIR